MANVVSAPAGAAPVPGRTSTTSPLAAAPFSEKVRLRGASDAVTSAVIAKLPEASASASPIG